MLVSEGIGDLPPFSGNANQPVENWWTGEDCYTLLTLIYPVVLFSF